MKTGILHYSVPPVVGGVENVILAHVRQFAAFNLPVTVIAGAGNPQDLVPGVTGALIPELDSQYPEIAALTVQLNRGELPSEFELLSRRIEEKLEPLLAPLDHVIIHNVLTKHFNLPLTAALFRLLERGVIRHAIAWCHDLSWTSPHSAQFVYERYPWNLLKTPYPNIDYVAISMLRQKEVAESFGLEQEKVKIVYNGVDAGALLGLSPTGLALANRLDLWNADLILLMPVRVTQAKNIEYALKFTAELKHLDICPKIILTGPPDPHSESSMAYFQNLLALRRSLDVENEFRFIFESGPDPAVPYLIDEATVSELYRVCDVLFMPSLREGFGMPVLEAGLLGMPVVCSGVPAAIEIALEDAFVFSAHTEPAGLAVDVLNWVEENHTLNLRRRIRQEYIWPVLFKQKIIPLLEAALE